MFYEVMPARNGAPGRLTYRYDGAETVGRSPSAGVGDKSGASNTELRPGALVEIPVGKFRAAGVVLKKVAQPEFRCREISKILYSTPLPAHLVKTAEWIGEYYQASAAGALAMILPNGILKKRRSSPGATKGSCLTAGLEFSARHTLDSRQNRPAGEPVGVVRNIRGENSNQSFMLSGTTLSSPPKTEQTLVQPQIRLNQAQKNALKGLQEALGATKLLFGVTGSGKTNIYLKMALKAVSEQKSVVLLVPEIALTGQLVRVFAEVFGEKVVMIHSNQTEVVRHRIFDSLLEAEGPRVVIGPRSALFAPLKDLGLIIIDEEHETTYYQENAPHYSAVRVASYMARDLGCDCILGSATPTLTDYHLAKKQGSLIKLTEKAKTGAMKPQIQVIDLKNRESFVRNRYFADKLLAAIKANLEQGRQTLLFHNRRGSSPLTICEQCGEELLCPNCYLPLTLHADEYKLRCHTCGFSCSVPPSCPKCGHPDLIHKGFGTKLLETELTRLFPEAKVRRFDADSRKGEGMETVYDEVVRGEVDILVGTQAIAKGLDLPRLATVGVVAADAGLSLPDFAAEERVFQLLTQVIGRVGRGHLEQAEVIVQTYRPEHPVLLAAMAEDYEGFAEYLLKARRRAAFPPYVYVMRCAVTAKTEATTLRKVRAAAAAMGRDPRLMVSPPMPAFHERTARGYTWELVVRAKVRRALIEACQMLDKNFRVTLDPPTLL